MSTITKPMALDESFNTSETNPRSIADVLAGIEDALEQGMGRQANEVSYDNTTSGLSADDVQEAVDELAEEKVDKVNGKGLSTNDYTDAEKTKLAGIEQGAQVNVQSDWAQTDSNADDYIKNKQLVTEPIEELQNEVESTQTVSGNPLTLTNVAPINAESLVVELEPKQDLHGQQYPYVGGAGKNKLPMTVEGIKAANTAGTWSGNVYTLNSGTFTILTDDGENVTGIKIHGTFTGNLAFYVARNISMESNSYILSVTQAVGTGASVYAITHSGNKEISTDTSVSFTDSVTGCAVFITANKAFTNYVLQPMIRLSTETDPTFAPYSNICPITGYDECGVDDVGKNLWSEGNVSGTLSNRIDISFPAGTYNMSAVVTSSDTDDSKSIVIVSDANDAELAYLHFGRGVRENFSFTVNKPIATIRFYASDNYVKSEGDTFTYSDIQLEKGTTATTYEPYHSSNATIQFGQTVYGGSVDFTEGGTDDDRNEVVFDGSDDESWIFNGGTTGIYSAFHITVSDTISITNSDTVVRCKCDRLRPISASEIGSTPNHTISVISNHRLYVIMPDIGTSVSDFKTWLASNNVQVVYEKATPTTIATPPTDLKLLKGTNNITSNGTTINLDYIPDNSIGDAVKASEEYTDRAVKREIEQHLEMPWLQVIIEGEQDDFDEILLEDGGNIIQFPLADNEIYKHRFLLFEVYTTLLGLPMSLCGNAMLSTQTLIEFEHGAYIPLSIGNLTDGITARVYVSITSDNEIQVQLESTASSPLTNIYIRARLVD